MLAVSLPPLLVRVSRPRPLVSLKLWVHTLAVLLLPVSVNPVRDLPLVSKVVLLVEATVKLFPWMKYGHSYLDQEWFVDDVISSTCT
jgi:hypothetical protein